MNYSRYIIVILLFFFVITNPLQAQVISTIAGPGNNISRSNDKIDILPTISNANGVAVDDSGNVYVAEYWDNVELLGSIFKFNPDDTLNKRAGATTTGEMLPRPPAHLSYPHGIAVDHEHNIYVAEFSSHIVQKITPQGKVVAVAGCGAAGYSGDKGNATSAKLSLLNGIALDHLGNVYIADGFNDVIRKVNTRGIISTFAGTGVEGYRSDGFQATRAQLNGPCGIAVDDTGNVYFSDTRNNVIRKVNPAGIISTIAGNGKAGYSGDGGPAIDARLNKPAGITLDNFGNLYAADEGNNVVRKIAADGIMSTIAGNGRNGYDGDGGPATSAALSDPRDVAIDSKGNMYIADFGNHVIRKVKIKIPFIPPPPVKIRPLAAGPASIAVKPSVMPLSTVTVPTFVNPEHLDKMPVLSAAALLSVAPAAFITPQLVTAPNFITPEPVDKIPLLSAVAMPERSQPLPASPSLATVPTFVQPEALPQISLVSAAALPVSGPALMIAPPLVIIPTFNTPIPLLNMPILSVVTLPVAAPLLNTMPPFVTIPTFNTPTPSVNIPMLSAVVFPVIIPPVTQQQLVTIPHFNTATPSVQIPMLSAIQFPATIPPATQQQLVTIPHFNTPTPSVNMPVLSAIAFPITIVPAALPSLTTVPRFITPTAIDKISFLSVSTFPISVASLAVPQSRVTIPTLIIPTSSEHISLVPALTLPGTVPLPYAQPPVALPIPTTPAPVINEPPQDEEDKVTVSINADNVMNINSEKGTYTSFSITNMHGEKILEQLIKTKQIDVDVKMLPAGQYYINLTGTKNEAKTLRFVKEN